MIKTVIYCDMPDCSAHTTSELYEMDGSEWIDLDGSHYCGVHAFTMQKQVRIYQLNRGADIFKSLLRDSELTKVPVDRAILEQALKLLTELRDEAIYDD